MAVCLLGRVCFGLCWVPGGSQLLDHVLGHEDHLMERSELKALVSIHAAEEGHGGQLTHDEATIIGGALDLVNKVRSQLPVQYSTVSSPRLVHTVQYIYSTVLSFFHGLLTWVLSIQYCLEPCAAFLCCFPVVPSCGAQTAGEGHDAHRVHLRAPHHRVWICKAS